MTQKRVWLWVAVLCFATPYQAQEREVVRIVAERFTFTPSRVTVGQGSTVEFQLRSEDTSHGFRIVGTDVNVRIPKRRQGVTTAIFQADQPGRYRFECSKVCGAGHNFMRGTIVVEEASSATGADRRGPNNSSRGER